MLGSASIDLLRQSGESLAGRIAYIDMGPLDVLEAGQEEPERQALWLRGGFPDSFLARSDAESLMLRDDFIRTCLERDVPQFGPRIPAETLERLRLWTMLAHGQPARRFVVYSGDMRFPVSADLEAVGVRKLAETVAEAS
jgi:predicted AAA+ superfamily ATPase